MNRLLFGVWSPTAFAEYERPFDLEFHSSAPGAPKVHTETEIDFSNITAACDSLEAQGTSTFSYLMVKPQYSALKWRWRSIATNRTSSRSLGWSQGWQPGQQHSLNWFLAVRSISATA